MYTTLQPALSFASLGSWALIRTSRARRKNADGSVDGYFANKAPAGQESNWIQTQEEKPFFVMFRIYGPQKGAVDGCWLLPNIEKAA
jgi:hypothetical protein